MAPKLKPVSEAGHVAEHGNGFRARIKINGNYTCGRTHPTRELAQADLNAARAGATPHGDAAAALKLQLSSSCVARRAVVHKSKQKPKQKPISHAGHISKNGSGFRARIFTNRSYTRGPTRITRQLAQADLNAARAGATSHAYVAATLKHLPWPIVPWPVELVQSEPATGAQNVAGAASAGGKSTEPPAKEPRALQEHFGREDIGAAEHVDRTAAAANLVNAGRMRGWGCNCHCSRWCLALPSRQGQ